MGVARQTTGGVGGELADRLYAGLDRLVTGVLVVLVVAMAGSITLEIVLNAGVQPILGRLIRAAAARGAAPAPVLLRLNEAVAAASAPVNTASQSLLVWVGILGSALALRRRAHLGVDALVRVYPRRARLALDRASTAVVGLFSLGVLVVGGAKVCQQAIATGSRMPGFEALNTAWFYSVLVVTGLLNLVYCFHHLRHPVAAGETPSGAEPAPEG